MSQRAPIVALGFTGLAIGAAFWLRDLGIIDRLWEPARVQTPLGYPGRVIGAPWPELDVLAFFAVVVLALVGRADRWRCQRALAAASGLAVVLAAASCVVRWTAQYTALHATSTLFVLSTAAALAMVPLAADELYAAVGCRKRGAGCAPPATYEGPNHSHVGDMATQWSGYIAGFTGIIVGVCLLASPAVMSGGQLAQHGPLLGAVVATIGAVSLAQVARAARWVNAAIGVCLVIAPLGGQYAMMGAVQMLLLGFALAIASSIAGDPTVQDHPRRRTA